MGRRLKGLVDDLGRRDDALNEWKEAAKFSEDELFERWSDLPVLTKDILRERFEPEAIRERFGVRGVVSSSGGSTGEPTRFLHDPPMLRATTAARLFAFMGMGWSPGITTIVIWGSERDIGKSRAPRARISALARNFWIVDGYAIDGRTLDRVMEVMDRAQKVVIFGFSSLLEELARLALERPPVAPGRVVTAWNGGEMLSQAQSELFERAFSVPILNLYGGREISAIGYQKRQDAPLSLLRPFCFLEIVNERGQPVPPGEKGRLLVTHTVCRGTPFIRYEIGDVGASNQASYDRAGVAALDELHGRTAGLLRLPSGKTISNLFWNHFFKDYPEIQQFQVVVSRERKVTLRLKGSPLAPEREARFRHTLSGFLESTEIATDWVDTIPTTIQGKRLQVVMEP